jgi:hypothetical protein
VGCPTGITAPGYSDKVIVIGRNPLFDGLPGLLDERNRGTDTLYRSMNAIEGQTLCTDSLYRFDTAGAISDFLCSQVWQSLRQGEYQNQG